MTPVEIAASAVAVLGQFSKLFSASRGLWSYIPAKWQWVPGTVALAIAELQKGLAGGIKDWTDLLVPVLLAAALFVPGQRSAAHAETLKVAERLADGHFDPTLARLQVTRAQVGNRRAPRLVGMALALVLGAMFLPSCTSEQLRDVAVAIAATAGKIGAIVAEASNALSWFESAAAIFFAAHPDPKAQARFAELVKNARTTLDAGQNLTHGARAVSDQQLDEAFADFRAAYSEIKQEAFALGIIGSDKASREAVPMPTAAKRFVAVTP